MPGKVVAIIPARGGSKRLPKKNLYPYFGKPLLQWAIEACQNSKTITDIYVSTEDADIRKVAEKLGVTIIDRPIALAADEVWTQEVLKHAVSYLENRGDVFDTIVRVQANSPQVTGDKIDEAVQMLRTSSCWEVFSVDEHGVEDAAIHVLKRGVVFQNALSVYKGVVRTDYIDIHTKEDLNLLINKKIQGIENEAHLYLQRMREYYIAHSWRRYVPRSINNPYFSLWGWQEKVPLHRRWDLILQQSPALRGFLESPSCFVEAQSMKILDLGCGFGMYWPILREYGFRTFVGIDLFDMRGRQAYLRAARQFVKHFCGDCTTQVIMDDVRNLGAHKLIVEKFDIILNIATVSTKAGSTGIPPTIFDRIVKEYGVGKKIIPVHIEKAH